MHELESAAAQEQNNVNHAYNILGDQLTNQVSDEEVLSLRQEVKQLKTEVSPRDVTLEICLHMVLIII